MIEKQMSRLNFCEILPISYIIPSFLIKAYISPFNTIKVRLPPEEVVMATKACEIDIFIFQMFKATENDIKKTSTSIEAM